jgi:hypothetical protein
MARAIGYEGDKGSAMLGTCEFIVEIAKAGDDLYVAPGVLCANEVGVAALTCAENAVYGPHMVFYMNPVSDVFAAAVDRDGLALHKVENGEGDEFFWKLIGAVVIAAVANDVRQAVGVAVGAYEVVGGGLRGGVGTAGIVGCAFLKKAFIGKAAIDFVRGYLIKDYIFASFPEAAG